MNKNVIKMTEKQFKINPKGLGNEIFCRMKYYHNKIMQIDAETERRETFGEVLEKAVRVAITLKKKNVSKDDVICICTDNNMEAVIPFLASLLNANKVASLDPLSNIEYLLKITKPKIIFTIENALKCVEEAIENLKINTEIVVFEGETFENYLTETEEEVNYRPEEISSIEETAVIVFSSGSTGLPKGICLSHNALLGQTRVIGPHSKENDLELDLNNCLTFDFKINRETKESKNFVLLSLSALYWISSISTILLSIHYGSCKLIWRNFQSEQLWKMIEKYKVTAMFLSTSLIMECLSRGVSEDVDISSLKLFSAGGVTFTKDQTLFVRKHLPNVLVYQVYGQTEMASYSTTWDINSVEDIELLMKRPGSCGRPLYNHQYKIVDLKTGDVLGPNQKGELYIKSPYLMNGYYGDEDSSNCFDSEDFFKTGDIMYFDEDKCFYHVDRIKELIKYKSWHVSPTLIEEVVKTHEAVKNVAVIGIPHLDGELPMAVVVLKTEYEGKINEDEVRKFAEERVSEREKLRGGVKFVKEIPYTTTGKVQRLELKRKIITKLKEHS